MFLSTFSRLGKIEGAISGLANKINGGGGAGGGGGGGKNFCLTFFFYIFTPGFQLSHYLDVSQEISDTLSAIV